MSSKGAGAAAILPELFRFGLYKPRQGRLVRQATFFGIAILAGFGAYALSGQLQQVSDSLKGRGSYVRVGIPLAVLAVACWCAFRAVNVPRFADFLISVEAELERVVWPSRQEVFQATIVVLVVMFSMGLYLTLADFIWKKLFELIGFIEY